MTRPSDGFFFRLVEDVGVEIIAALAFGLLDLDLDSILVGPGVLANARDLPRDLHICGAGPDDETIALDLFGDDGLRKRPDDGELITEVSIQRLEVIGQRDNGFAI